MQNYYIVTFKTAVATLLTALFLVWVVTATMKPVPAVYKSWVNQECIKVSSNNPTHSCENLPVKYNNIWVQ